MACTHSRERWVTERNPYAWDEEDEEKTVLVTESTTVDLDTHRYQCTQCKKVMYYSGAARDFHEKGIRSHVKGLGG